MAASTQVEIVLKVKDEATALIKNFGKNMVGNFDQAKEASKEFGVGLAGVAASVGAFVGFGAKVAGDLEASRQGFVTLLGSAKEADAVLALIKKDAAATPFELPGLISANMLLTGVTKNGQQSETLLLSVGKALSAMGKGQPELDRLIVNLQQIGAVGKASMMDIKQFAFAGIPIFEMLKDKTGLAGDALNDFISGGGVTFKLLEDMFNKAGAAGGRFADAFKNQAGTFNQLMSNMSDSFTIFASDVIQQTGIFDMLKNALTGVINFMTEHKDDIVAGMKEGMEFIKNNGPIIAGIIIGALVPALYAFAVSVGAATLALAPYMLAGLALGLLAKVIIDNWTPMTEFFTGLWATVVAAFTTAVSFIQNSIITPLVNFFMTYMYPTINAVFQLIMLAVILLVSAFLDRMIFLRDAVVKPIVDWFMTYVYPVMQQAFNAIMAAVRVVTDWFNTYVAPQIKNAFNAVSSAVAALAKWFEDRFNEIKKKVDEAISFVTNLINNFKPKIEIGIQLPNIDQAWKDLKSKAHNLGIPGFQTGGVVPGPIGAPRIIMAHGGEKITPNGVGGSGGGSGVTNNFHVHIGLYAGSQVEKRNVAQELYAALVQVAMAQNKDVKQLMGA